MATHLSVCYKKKLFLSLIICSSYLITFQRNHLIFALRNTTYSHIALALDSVLLNCGGKAEKVNRWIFNGQPLFSNKMCVDDRFGDTVVLIRNYNLLITNVSLDHEGIYKCARDSQIITTHSVKVEVLPSVELNINGKSSPNQIIIQENTTIESTCLAKGSRPPVHLTWKINNAVVQDTLHVTTITLQSRNDPRTYDTVSTMKYVPEVAQGNIKCQIKALSAERYYHASFYVEVQPSVQLTVNGQSSDKSIKVAHREDVLCTCLAFKYRLQANISWIVNSEVLNPKMVNIHKVSSNTEFTDTFDTLSSIVIQPNVRFGSITCVVNTANGKEHYYTSFYVQDIRQIIVPVTSVCAMLCFMICFWCICRRVRRTTRDENVKHNEGLAMRRSNVASRFHLWNAVGQTKCAAKNTRDAVCLKDVICTKKLHSKGNTVYWKAKCYSTATGRIDILAKCISGRASRLSVLAFQTLGDLISSFPEHDNIVTTFGLVKQTNGPFYIYQEYLNGGTLRDFLRKCNQTKYKQNREEATNMMTNILLQIVDGMSFLLIRNFHHPALSTRKVLLHQDGRRCSLYDFWPQQLVPDRVRGILEKPNPPVAWLPPETNLRLKYCHKSDVWTFAILMWEVFTFGSTPYTGMTGKEIAKEIRHNHFLERPKFCHSNLFDVMLSAWDISRAQRPTFDEISQRLRNSLNMYTEEMDHDEESSLNYANYCLN